MFSDHGRCLAVALLCLFGLRRRGCGAMFGPQLLVETLSRVNPNPDKYGNLWQYHSRGDRHSKVACWGILFDLLLNCPPLVEHVRAGTVAFGINHEMRDFEQDRKKNLDLVICTPSSAGVSKDKTFASLGEKYGIVLPSDAQDALAKLPLLPEAAVGAVRVALEAKAAMTAHVRALPRLHDELNSSHAAIHGASENALAVGFVMVNIASRFASSDLNKQKITGKKPLVFSNNKQPDDAIRVIDKVKEIKRKSASQGNGFDAMGILVVDCINDGKTAVRLHTEKPAPQPQDIFHYESLIHRLAELYRVRFL